LPTFNAERFHAAIGPGLAWRWRVWDELPADRVSGYLIVFDPRAGEWDLATKPRGRRFGRLSGFRATSFKEALEGM
jgi:hypothetical protein